MRFQTLDAILPELEDLALRYFRAANLTSSNKAAEGFDPVTRADQEIEACFRDWLAKTHPHDAILGEEFANTASDSDYQWIIDPIDGTRAYVMGIPSFAILIALKARGEFKGGVISQPFMGERFWGLGDGARYQRGRVTQALSTGAMTKLSEAKLASTFPEIGTKSERSQFEGLASQCLLTRYGLDAYAYGLLAMGHIDLIAEAGLKPFDYAATQAVVEAAGGIVTNWQGQTPRGESTILASANQTLHEKALRALNA